jgi:transposase
VAELDACIQGRFAPLAAAVARVQTIPGIKAVAAAAILAEIGTDMSPFPTDAHLASWAGLCPGNHESAGKRKSGRTRPENRWRRAAMTEAAWAAARTTSTALRAAYDRIARRRGRKRALLALAHRLLVVVDHVLNTGCTDTEFGAHYLDRRCHEAHTRYFFRRRRELGYEATLRPLDAPPPVAA